MFSVLVGDVALVLGVVVGGCGCCALRLVRSAWCVVACGVVWVCFVTGVCGSVRSLRWWIVVCGGVCDSDDVLVLSPVCVVCLVVVLMMTLVSVLLLLFAVDVGV